MGLTESVKGKFRDKKQIKSLDSVIISVQKLYNLSENILNVKFIEDLSFWFKKDSSNDSKINYQQIFWIYIYTNIGNMNQI